MVDEPRAESCTTKHAKSGINALFVDDREKLWHACKDLKEKMVMCIMYHGMRDGELGMMDKTWVLWQTNQIQIQGTKSEHALRTIPMVNGRLRETMERYFSVYDNLKDAHLSNQSTLWRICRRVAKRTDIRKYVFTHGLRATCALMLAESGYDERGLCAFMGWKDLSSATPYLRLAGRAATDSYERLKKQGINFV